MAGETKTYASKKGVWGWMLFDWAQQPYNTLIITFVFAPYFANFVAPNAAAGQSLWGWTAGVGGLIIALTSPIFGAIADATGPRKPWILVFSVIGVIGCWLLWYATPGMQGFGLVMFALIIALIGMEFAAVFNNAMMPTLAPREELGRLSGTAWGLGYIGGLIALAIVLGLLVAQPSTGKTLFGIAPLFGLDQTMHEGDRMSGPLTAVWCAVFLIPMFLWTPDVPRKATTKGAVARGLGELKKTLLSLPKQKSYFSFLLSSMIYRDALNALYTFGGIYAGGVLGWSIIDIGIFGILASLTGAIGAWMGGIADQKYGPKTVVAWTSVILTLCCIVIISTTKTSVLFLPVTEASSWPTIAFYIAGAFIGAAGGSLQAASRTLLVDQVPEEKVTEAFGLYALSGRATSFLAPFAIALATQLALENFGFDTVSAQRIGVVPIVVLFVVGLVLLRYVRGLHPHGKAL